MAMEPFLGSGLLASLILQFDGDLPRWRETQKIRHPGQHSHALQLFRYRNVSMLAVRNVENQQPGDFLAQPLAGVQMDFVFARQSGARALGFDTLFRALQSTG